MKIITNLQKMHDTMFVIKKMKNIAFIPTMGAFHSGHMSLIKKASLHNSSAIIVVSLFANPRQFTNVEDFEKYPNSIESDIKKLLDFEKTENIKINYLFVPEKNNSFYSDKKYPKLAKYNIDISNIVLPNLFSELEGDARTGHFEGVFQVLFRLFYIISPHYVVFGQKDFQQTVLVKYLKKKYFPNIEIIIADILREPSGLAMSSRNERLSTDEKNKAKIIYEGLIFAQLFISRNIEKIINSTDVINIIKKIFFSEKLIEQIYYIEIRNGIDLTPVNIFEKNQKYIILVSVQFAGIHLIDNIIVSV